MTTREQYKSRFQQLESEIEQLDKETEAARMELEKRKLNHDSEEYKKAFGEFWRAVGQPNKDKKEQLQREANHCRIRSLEKFYCNRHLYTDIQPYEVIEVQSDTQLKLRSMNYVQTQGSVDRLRESFEPGGFMGHFDNSVQEWICTPDPKGITVIVRRHRDGHFYEPNDDIPYVLSDRPVRYRDFNF